MSFIHLDRPLVIFDIESTGLNPRTDRIIELSAMRLHPDHRKFSKTWLLNPTIPIPLETIAIHGITDDMVKACPTFAERAQEIFGFFKDCDLGGFSIGHLDIPILEEEFARVGLRFNAQARRQFDAQRIFHKREPRDLTAAMQFYCGKPLEDAHGAEADAQATLEVLKGEFARYPDLPTDPDELDRYLNDRDPFLLDRDGKLRWVDGEVTINFGRKKGLKLRELAETEPEYLYWIVRSDFAHDTKEIVRNIIAGKYPKPPAVTPTSGPAQLS